MAKSRKSAKSTGFTGGRLVYSTGGGRVRQAPTDISGPVPGGIARIRRETKRRGGKVVTVIWDLPDRGAQLKQLGKTLRKLCGTGGTVKKGGTIELQGDQVEAVTAYFADHDRPLRHSGG